MYSKYTGIILKKYPFGEADELLTIYTKEAGKLRAKAAGSRKIKSRLAGHLQSLNEISFETVAGTRRSLGGGGLPLIISVRALSINNYLRENLKKFAFALVGIETLYRMCADRQANVEIYNHLAGFLKDLGETPDENLAVRRFQLDLLAASGYALPESIIPASVILRYSEESQNKRDSSASTPQNDKSFLTPEMESEIDKHLQYVLEREIKSNRFLDTLT